MRRLLVRTVYLSANYLRMIKQKIHLQKQLPHDLDLLKQTKSILTEFISQTTAACCILNTIGAEEKSMKYKYYGTGAAEAIPAIWCDCDTCERARKKGRKKHNEQKSADNR